MLCAFLLLAGCGDKVQDVPAPKCGATLQLLQFHLRQVPPAEGFVICGKHSPHCANLTNKIMTVEPIRGEWDSERMKTWGEELWHQSGCKHEG